MPTTGQADTVTVATDLSVTVNDDPAVAGDGLTFDGLGGVDTIEFSTGTYVSWLTDFTLTATAAGVLTLANGTSSVQFDNFESLVFSDLTIDLGTAEADIITGGALDDAYLFGLGGADTIDGGAGADTMYGDGGNDTYIVDDAGDSIVEAAGGGIDLVESSVTHTLAANVEDLTLTGTGNVNGTGNAQANNITGNAGANRLNGGGGTDILVGLDGNDIYVIAAAGDTITETATGGTDTVEASITITSLASNVENLSLTGTGNINGTGNALDNEISGNAGDNTLNGGAGSDTIVLLGTSDQYTFEALTGGEVLVTDSVAGRDGVDTIQLFENVKFSDSTVTLASLLSGGNVINGTANNDVLPGTSASETINGLAGDDTLGGSAGNDSLVGGTGDDTYIINSTGDDANEKLNEGTDKVQSSIAIASLWMNIEDLTLTGSGNINGTGNGLANVITGNAGNNTLTGLGGDDTLNGGGGIDVLVGGAGDDTYILDVAGDTITEAANGGTDTARTAVSLLTLDSFVENLVLTGAANINGGGNDLDNVITGNSGNNVLTGGLGKDTLNGGGGTDTLKGEEGDDTYIVAAAGVTITELSAAGNDKVNASISFILGANLEDLTLTGLTQINGTGNGLANTITGNSADNQINGGAGNDTLKGGAGNDVYFVDSTGDSVIENFNDGTDEIRATVTVASLAANVESLVLLDSGVAAAYGNALNNTIVGNSSANSIDGGAGSDDMTGGAGNDVYFVDSLGDKVNENADGGHDVIYSSISLNALALNVEDISLIGIDAIKANGNGLNNRITGNAANNIIVGGGGADFMSGGYGNDTYYIDSAADIVKEYNGLGSDTIYTSVDIGARAYIERVILTGDAIKLNGNALNNTLIGNARANIVTGGGGADTMQGGAGSDTYVYNMLSDSRAGSTHDTITGFMHGFDKIDLFKIDANGSRSGNGSFSFIGSSGFSGVAGQLHAVKSGFTFHVEGDVNGDRVADLQIFVGGAAKLTASDFIL